MAGKARVHELAKELGTDSKTVLARLKELGEFVKSASSTVEAPVARRLRESFPSADGGTSKSGSAPSAPAATGPAGAPGPDEAPKPDRPAKKQAGAKAAPRPGPGPRPGPSPRPGPPKGVGTITSAQNVEVAAAEARAAELKAAQEAAAAQRAAAAAETPATPAVEPEAPTTRPKPATGPRPGPRPGNNPFGVGAAPTPAPRPGPRTNPPAGGQAPGSGRPNPAPGGMPSRPASPGGQRPGGPRPGPGSMPPRPNPGMMPARPGPGGSGGPGGGGGGGRPGGPGAGRGGPGGGGGGRPGGPGAGRGGPGGGGGRPGGPGGGPGGGGGGYRGGTGTGTGAPGGGGGGGYRGGPGGGAPSGPGGGGGRPGGGGRARGGGAAGAFGRPSGGRGPARGRKSKKQRRQEFDNLSAPTMGSGAPRGHGEVVRLPRGASLSDFADKIDANPGSLVQEAFGLGEMVTATQSCSDETLQLMGEHLGYDVQIVSPEDEDRELLARFDIDMDIDYSEESLVSRPPVVTVMGHVDHGKTKLLDAIRSTSVAEGEAGGITQHIGAYQVTTEVAGNERKITFIDTPGHEAFTAMRARGAQATDIVILVVAANDGVMPQTIEALNHAKAAGVPIVVAVNKIDVEGANPAKVRQQLTEYGLVAEEYGGDVMFVDISAKQRLNIDGLLEAVILTADATLVLTAPVDVPATGISIEGHLDRGRGPVATVLIQAGTLRVGDSVVVGDAFGRVRAMLDENLASVAEAGPSRPVQILGLTSVAGAGDAFLVVGEDRVARQIAQQRQARERNAKFAASRGRATLETLLERMKEGEKTQLNLIIKGDMSGSVEALEDALLKIDVGEDVNLRVLHRGVGAINQEDVNLATIDGAVIIGFNVRPEGRARELAERENVDIRYYSVIYAAIDDIEAALKGMLKPEFEEVQLGTAEVREVYRSSKFGNIAGCLVRSGLIRRNAKARLVRDGAVVADNLSIDSLKRFKDDATEVREGYECGVGLGSFNDIKVDDVIETFELREKPRS